MECEAWMKCQGIGDTEESLRCAMPTPLGRFYMRTCISGMAKGLETDTAQCPHALLPIGRYKAGKLRATGIYSSSDTLCAYAACKRQEIPYAKPVPVMLNTGENVGQKRVFD